MSKKIVLIIVALLLLAGGAAGGYFMFQSKAPAAQAAQTGDTAASGNSKEWNPWSSAKKPQKTLGDFLLSASGGAHIVKLNVTLEFKDEEGVNRFLGLDSAKAKPAAESGTKELTPMASAARSYVNNVVAKADESKLKNKELLEQDLEKYLNEKLGFGADFIKKVYVADLVIQ